MITAAAPPRSLAHVHTQFACKLPVRTHRKGLHLARRVRRSTHALNTPTPSPAATARVDQIDAGEFSRLFTGCTRVLWCIAASIVGDREHARDIVQSAAITGLDRLAEFTPGSNFTAWMGQIVRFTALNEGRKQHRRAAFGGETTESLGAPRSGSEESPVSRFGSLIPDQTAFDDATVAALQQLEETARACLLLRTVLDMPYPAIAESLGIPEGTAMSHVHRARRKVRELLLASPDPTHRTGGRP